MTDVNQAVADVAKRRSALVGALLATLLVVVAIVAAAYIFELWPFGEMPLDALTPDSSGSHEATRTARPAVPPEPTLTLPPVEAQEVLYWEQIASAAQINDLVEDKVASFELSEAAALADTANVRVKANYRDGSSLYGWLLLRKYNDTWYFSMITRDGHPWTTPQTGLPDMAVAKAIAEGNAANQEIFEAVLAGGYTVVTVDTVTAGSGTAILECTFSGGSEPPTEGRITCISKDVNGARHWFVTAFATS